MIIHSVTVMAMTVCSASVRLCKPAKSSRNVDIVKCAVFYLHDGEDALDIASCHDPLIQLYLPCRGSAAVMSARFVPLRLLT